MKMKPAKPALQLMKRYSPLLLLILLLAPLALYAQENVSLAHIEVALWPDFDDPSTLVLATGTMPDGADLPIEITFPLPEGYNRLVVARVTDDGRMIDDLETLETSNSVTFSSPEPRFRIEYYVPYTADDNQREIEFIWGSSVLNADAFQVTVQRPAPAAELTINPAAVGEVVGQDTGLTEYLLSEQPMPAGESYRVMVNYEVNSRLLSVDLINDQNLPTIDNTDGAEAGNVGETAVSPTEKSDTLILTLGIIGAVLIAIAATWYIATHYANHQAVSKPKPHQSKKKRKSVKQFCHECGSSMDSGAKFCASCGTAKK